jgi:four helix bundle protein
MAPMNGIYDRKQFAKDLEKRTLNFGIRIIHLSIKLPNTPEGRVVKKQITGSGTSMGANYREANRSQSKADFKHRIKICESEASETQYWMKIIEGMNWLSQEEMKADYDECAELLAIFTSIGKKLR